MKSVITTDQAPGAIGSYSQAVKSDGLLFVSGQLGIDPETGSFASEEVREQTRQALKNARNILKAGGCGMEDVLKTTVLLADMGDFADMNAAYAEFFPENPPARAAFQVAALPLNGRVEIELTASAK